MITAGFVIFVFTAWAVLLDAVFGDPPRLYARVPHPVDLMAKLLMTLEKAWNHPATPAAKGRALGLLVITLCVVVVGGLAWLVQWVSLEWMGDPLGWPLVIIPAYTLLAGRGLLDHVRVVRDHLVAGDTEAARWAVGRIVGRDTAAMDPPAMARAATESLAENFSDGLVAPVFWFVLLGLPGLAAYKMINTADSLIGHRNARFQHFGWAAARLDDGVNWIPARLTVLLFALAKPSRAHRTLAAAWRDGPRHVSPNAGWPEAALAGALDLRLGGPRQYQGRQVDGHWIGDGEAELTADHLSRAIHLGWFAFLWLEIWVVTPMELAPLFPTWTY